VHFSRKIWHLVTVDDLYRAINAQQLNVIRPNIVNILTYYNSVQMQLVFERTT